MTSPHPGADLLHIAEIAMEREGHLLTAGECRVVERIRGLSDRALELYARLLGRVGPVFRVASLRYEDVPAGIAELCREGLAITGIPDDRCADAFDVPDLRAACRRLGLDGNGRRAELVGRLVGRRWVDERVVMPLHAGLVARLELFYFQSPNADRTVFVLERLGTLRWAEYVPTGGPGLFATRAALRRYERARAGEWLFEDEPLAIAREGRGDAPLSPWSRAVAVVLESGPSADVLGALTRSGAQVRVEWARALEREGRVAEALAVARDADPADRLELRPLARRVARACGVSLPPEGVVPSGAARHLVLAPGGFVAGRPRFGPGGGAVEDAVIEHLGAVGRASFHAENWFWVSLFALVFRDLYFLPVPGMLPTARRSGPLDLGTPGFAARRRAHVEGRLAEVERVGVESSSSSWTGERLAGLALPNIVGRWAGEVPGPMAAAILGRMAWEGWSAARGLPDLFVAAGTATDVPGAIPRRLRSDAFLVELKAPGDKMRSHQVMWGHHLTRRGIPVELWTVSG